MTSIEYAGVIQPKTFTIKWKIEGFHADCEKIGDHHESPMYPIQYSDNNTNWYLKVYPKGYTEEDKGYLSLYLMFHSENENEVTVDYQFSIACERNSLTTKKKARYTFSQNSPGDNQGCSKYIEQSFIEENGALIDDTLTIFCKMTFDPEQPIFTGYDEELKKIEKGFDHIETLFGSDRLYDVTLNIQGKTLNLHKAILSCRSPVFKDMFERELSLPINKKENKKKQQTTVDITEIDYHVMKELIRFVYSRKVNNIENIVGQLLHAANKYRVDDLKVLCENTLYARLSVDNAIEFLKLAQSCDTIHLKKLLIEFIVDNLTDIVKTADFKLSFKALDRDVVCEIMEAVAERD